MKIQLKIVSVYTSYTNSWSHYIDSQNNMSGDVEHTIELELPDMTPESARELKRKQIQKSIEQSQATTRLWEAALADLDKEQNNV